MQVNFKKIKEEVEGQAKASKRDPNDVRLVAVSKTVGVEEVKEAFDQGARDFGENRPEELVKKATYFQELREINEPIRWHFIGNIQSRQIKNIVSNAYLIHSLEKFEHARKIDRVAREIGKVQKVLVEVNVSKETSKGGIYANDLPSFLDSIKELKNLEVVGIMTMAPIQDEQHADLPFPAKVFSDARKLLDDNEQKFSKGEEGKLVLSAGMTNDWKDAISAGSTCVRIGRAIFSA